MKWTPEMIDYLREITPGSTTAEIREMLYRRFGVLFSPSAISNAKVKYGVRSGIVGGRFERGMTPHNKGRRQTEFMSAEAVERTRATRFAPGDEPVTGARVPVGTERLSKDGYVEVKVSRLSDRPNANKCWKPKHRLIWEREHGPVPDGHIVVFADGDKRNFAPDNLVCISRADAAQINRRGLSYHDAESLQVAVDIVRLGKAVYDKQCSERPCRSCGQTFKPRYPHQRTCDECLGRRRPESTLRPPDGPNSDDQTETGIDAQANEISD